VAGARVVGPLDRPAWAADAWVQARLFTELVAATRTLNTPRGPWAARERLRSDAIPLLQAALAAGLAWFLARDLVGHAAPIFAPIGALLILSNAPGHRTGRVLAATLGAVIGIAVGDLLVRAIGTGAIQVAVVALFAMSATAAAVERVRLSRRR
jgi:Fusaric acid resistance protein-like